MAVSKSTSTMQLTTYQAVIAQSRAFRALRTFMSTTLLRHNLTMTQWLMLGMIVDAKEAGVRVSDLADVLGVEMPVVTNLVNRAEQAGQIRRVADDTDKRSRRIVVTPEFAECICAIEGELQHEAQQWMCGLSRQDMDGYFAIVEALATCDNKSYTNR